MPAETVLIADIPIEDGFKMIISGGTVSTEDPIKPNRSQEQGDATPEAEEMHALT